MQAPIPPSENARLTALLQYEILDTAPEPQFDDITHLAAQICNTPFAALTLIDRDRQWFKSSVGWEFQESSRELSFCAHTILEPGFFSVQDTFEDKRFEDNPFVISEPYIRFYAGVPLISANGLAVGTLCVCDSFPRKLDSDQQEGLCRLARHALALLEARVHSLTEEAQNAPDLPDLQKNEVLTSLRIVEGKTNLPRFSTEHYQRLFDSSTDGILILEAATGKIQNINPHLCGWLGHNAQELKGKLLWEIVAFQVIAASQGAFQDLRKMEYVYRDDILFEIKGRPSFPVEIISSVYFSGETEVVQCNIRDISARQVEQAIVTRLAAIVESSDDAIISKNLDGTITTWNASAERLYGYSALEMIGRSISILVPAEMPDEMPQLLERVGRGELVDHYETIRVRKDGARVQISLSISPLKDATGQIIGASSIKRDITQRKLVEQALIDSEQEQRRLAESLAQERRRLAEAQAVANMGSWELDLISDVLVWSEENFRIFGIEPENFGGTYQDFLNCLNPDDGAVIDKAYTESVANHTIYAVDHAITMKDGSTKIVHERCQTFYDEGGRPIRSVGTTKDITERKQQEASLIASQQRLLLATHAAQLGVWDWDVVRNKMVWDAQMMALYGIEEQNFSDAYDAWHKGLHPGDRESAELDLTAALEGDQEFHPQFRVVWPNGEVHWIEAHGLVHRGIDGQPLRMIGVSWDITKRKQDEVELRHSEERYRSLILATAQIVWKTKANGMMEDMPAWRDFTGQTEDEVQGRGWLQALHPDDRERFEATIGTCQEIGVYKDEYRVRSARGDYRFFAVRGVPVLEEDGSIREWVGTFTDIQDRRQAEEERDRFFTLSLEMLAIAGFDGYFKRVNPAFLETLGWTEEEFLSTPFLEISHPDDEPATRLAIAKLAEGGAVAGFENRYRTKQGAWRWLEWKSVAVPAEGLIYAAARDVTDRKEAEAALRQMHEDLAVRVEERTAELARAYESLRIENIQREMTLDTLREVAEALQLAKEEADSANAAKSEFLSRMSHELRTPLNAILGFGQILEVQDLTPRQQESIGYILKGGRHLLGLINEVLDIARVEAGHIDLSLEPVAINEVLAEVSALVQPLSEARHIIVSESTLQVGRIYVLADLQRLKQVLLNLLSNAIKYNREGGRVEVFVTLEPEDCVVVAIRDTGPGISSQDLPKLFTPFERLNAAASSIEGTGLGLVLSRRLVTAMKGSLDVTSIVGQGTTFTIKLPQSPSPEEQVTNVPEDIHLVPTNGQVEHIYSVLCIEDNPSNLRLIEAILESRPEITLLCAMQGSVGLDLARQHEPNLILLDLDLPDIKGSEVLTRLQRSALTKDIPVVVVSADATPGQIERLHLAGAKAYLTKPLDVELFLYTLNQFLVNPNN